MSQPIERESMEVDVLYVGAGPATLASALHLMNQVEAYNERATSQGGSPIEPPTVLIIEKSEAIGEHILSGAVMNPKGIAELTHLFTNLPDGTGAVMLDGKMQDDATWKQAKVIVDLANLVAEKDPDLAASYDA